MFKVIVQQQILDGYFVSSQTNVGFHFILSVSGFKAHTEIFQAIIPLHTFLAITGHSGIQQCPRTELHGQRFVRLCRHKATSHAQPHACHPFSHTHRFKMFMNCGSASSTGIAQP